MKKEILLWLFAIGICTGCKQCFVNKHTSRIYNLNTECLSDSVWTELEKYHSVKDIKDSTLLNKLIDFENMPFSNEVYYFDGKAPELIAVSTEHDCVRYVYNPLLSNEVLDGLSPQLSKGEKERVGNRMQSFLRKYQCKKQRTHRYHQEWDE